MRIASLIESCLIKGGFSSTFSTSVPSAVYFPEAIVLLEGPFERESRIEGEDRGHVAVTVLVVRDVSADAEAVAVACEKCVRGAFWEAFGETWPWRIVGVDVSAPFFKERDRSGRCVWQLSIDVAAVRLA